MRLNKKIISMIIVILIILTSFSILAEENEKQYEIKEFILQIYRDYQDQNFEFVYEKMHPDIKTLLDKDKYIKFQKANTEKYSIEISKVEVIEVNEIKEWPEPFIEIIKSKENYKLYEIKIKYLSTYQSSGSEQEKTIEKNSYVVENSSGKYLLWNPEIID